MSYKVKSLNLKVLKIMGFTVCGLISGYALIKTLQHVHLF
jgi:hypothetical protein